MFHRKILKYLIILSQLGHFLNVHSPAFAQPIFRHFTKQDGAPENTLVNKIIQDKRGFMWFATTDGLFKYDSRIFTAYLHDPKDPRSINDNYVQDIICDRRGDLWFAANGLVRHNQNNDTFDVFAHNPENKNSLSSNGISCIMEDRRTGLWIGTNKSVDYFSIEGTKVKITRYPLPGKHGGFMRVRCMEEAANGILWIGTDSGLVRIKKDGTEKTVYESVQAESFPATNMVNAIHIDINNEVWVGFKSGGICRLDTTTGKFIALKNFKAENTPFPEVRKFVSDGSNRLWVATTCGLAQLDIPNTHCQWYTNEYGHPNSLTNDVLYAVCVDRQGGVWTGSYGAGIDYFYPESAKFHTLRFPNDPPGTRPFDAAWIGGQKGKDLWAVPEDRSKVMFFKPRGGTHRTLPVPLNPPSAYSVFFVDRDGIIWSGGFSVLARYDLRKGKIDYYPLRVGNQKQSIKGRTLYIFEDSKKRLWVAGEFGLLLFDKRSNIFEIPFADGGKSLLGVGGFSCITEDSMQNLWVGGRSLYVLKTGSNGFENIRFDRQPDPSHSGAIYSIKEDASGRVWFGTGDAGLQVYNPVQNWVGPYHKGRKLSIGVASCIQLDSQGYIWLNGEGLTRYHPDHQTIQHFDQKDGLPSDQLRIEANFQDLDGTLFYGTPNGIFYFNPGEIKVNKNEQPIVFSSLKLFNKPVQAGDETGVLSQSLYTSKEIVFRHDQNIFTLDFATLNYIRADKNRYAYMLEGFEKQWNYVSAPSATYTNLSPGSYTFLVKAANNDGYWNKQPARLTITVLPPWWATWYAYLAYLAIFAAAIYAVTRFFWARSTFRRESELYQAKLDFFTNVSHEIRTHLTLIDGPLQKAFQSRSIETDTRNLLSYAKRNSDKLMGLVSELLEFRKMESGEVTLQVSEENLVDHLKIAHSAFELFLREKQITTSLAFPGQQIQVWYDASQMQKVFYNLLSNACKFTPEGGTVQVTVEEDDKFAWVNVIDNGRGISDEHLEKIFESFFQENNHETPNRGYGIGLALSRNIVERHQGRLTVTSRNQAGEERETCFRIQLLKGNVHFNPSEISKYHTAMKMPDLPELVEDLPWKGHSQSISKHTVLLIEDNEELRAFSRQVLENSYKVLEAANGLSGLEIAREQLPDLIVSDIMMSEMDGLDLCTELKSDVRTSHIPIILLTAKGATHHLIQGLKAGADAYIVKPFDIRVLELKIKNLIHIRQVLQHRNNPFVSVGSDGVVLAALDKQFLARLTALVEQNISDVEFGVTQIAEEMGISLSVLYRKLKALTGMTVNDFVKSVRMQKAVQLLSTKAYNVNEVALMVGFENRKYFSREFRKIYGRLPSKYEGEVIEK